MPRIVSNTCSMSRKITKEPEISEGVLEIAAPPDALERFASNIEGPEMTGSLPVTTDTWSGTRTTCSSPKDRSPSSSPAAERWPGSVSAG